MKIIKNIFYISISTGLSSSLSLYGYIYYKSKQDTKSKLNIIFDLDETIIHTDKISNYNNMNKKNILKPESLEIMGERKIWIRPYIYRILPLLSKFNNLFLFTKATEPYTNDILMKTNLNQYFIDKRYREDCKGICKNFLKFNLSNMDVKNTLLVDDKLSNKCEGQNFYHIPKFNYFQYNDIHMIKLFLYILWLNIKKDLDNK
jgi:TFIIF-interacting CTD phosphatase-like protein